MTCIVPQTVLKQAQEGKALAVGLEEVVQGSSEGGGWVAPAPLLFAGRLLDCESASVYVLEEDKTLHGLCIASDV